MHSLLHKLFTKIKTLFTPDKFKIVIIPSYRTPEEVIKKAYDAFSSNHHVVKTVDKKAYLSSLAIADFTIVTCDSTSMISGANMCSCREHPSVSHAMCVPKPVVCQLPPSFSPFLESGKESLVW